VDYSNHFASGTIINSWFLLVLPVEVKLVSNLLVKLFYEVKVCFSNVLIASIRLIYTYLVMLGLNTSIRQTCLQQST